MKRKVVMDTGCLYKLGSDEKTLNLIKNAGFKYFDMSLYWKGTTEHIGTDKDYIKKAQDLRKYADRIGLECVQTHSYFNNTISEEINKIRIEYVKKDIKISSILGAKCVVIHPVNKFTFEQNVEYLKNFIPLANKYDIKLAIENVWDVKDNKICAMNSSRPDDLIRLIDALNDDHVVACLDIGHAEMNQLETSAEEMILALKDKLYCLHIHDNDKWCDAHQIPYTQKINFNKVLRALKSIDYKGNITFEVESCFTGGGDEGKSLPLELYPAFVKLLFEIGNYFVDFLDK